MLNRWTHAHTFTTGLVAGLVLDKEALVVLALGIALGAGTIIGWRWLRRLFGWGKEAASSAAASLGAVREAEADRKRAAAEELRSRAEHRTRSRAEQDAAVRRAYYEGARDGGRLDGDERPSSLLGIEVGT